MPDPSHILVVDDSPTQLRQIQFLLEKEGFVVQSAMDGIQAIASIEETMPLLVVTDLQMPEMNGLELVASLKESMPSLPVILTTSQGSEEIASQALKAGAASYVPKRELNDTLIPVLQQVMAVNKATKAVPRLPKMRWKATSRWKSRTMNLKFRISFRDSNCRWSNSTCSMKAKECRSPWLWMKPS
jgi:CheY-like chemotaxis protein